MKQRKFDRKQCIFSVYQSNSDGNGSGGVILNLSEDGANVLVNTENASVDNDFHISIYPSPGFKQTEFIEINAHKVWEEDSGIDKYKKVGCRFKSISKDQKKKLKKLID
ncbi:MAG: PilZ domain-containing protein [Spirochaetota bacterium]|nr:PilZ domain-containing protein [Spirochaetota bacterium]